MENINLVTDIGSSEILDKILSAIREVAGPSSALHEPRFEGNEWKYLKECLDSTFVSSVGKFVDRFESELAQFTGADYAVAVVNGTSALHLALTVGGVKAGEEVLIPALTFVATAAAVIYCNAIPHFVDSDEISFGINTYSLRRYLKSTVEMRGGLCVNIRTNRVIRAIIPMHTFGNPVDMEGLISIARDFNLKIIEDAAESLGSYIHGKHTGTFGVMGVLSFNGNKIITAGGGGAIITNNLELATLAKHLSTTAKISHSWLYQHDMVGYNYRLPNLNAALACAQLEQIDYFLYAKRKVFEKYKIAFSKIPEVSIVGEREGCLSNYWLNTLMLGESIATIKDDILTATNLEGIMTRPAWTLMHKLPPYANYPRMDLAVAESLERRIINLPSSVSLGMS